LSGTGAFKVGDRRVDPAANLVTRGDETIRLEPKVMDVLVCLTRHAGEVVRKREIIDEVWRTEFITEKALTRAIGEIRRALGDDARNPTYIRTISKRGYQLLVEVVPDSPRPGAHLPAFLTEEISEPERPVFVARETELAELDARLDRVLEGHGTVVFVTGEAGVGKTALLLEFCRRAQERIDDLIVAAGACPAATGAGDPYGPWRQVLAQLAGDVEGRVARGALGVNAARRLWEGLPVFVEAVASFGRDLVETLIAGSGLATRAAIASPNALWLGELESLVERKFEEPPDASLQQGAVFLQVGRVLRTVADTKPVVLAFDDLQWADTATLALLCDIGRQLEGSGLLLVGAYRPEDVGVGRGGEIHPLAPVLAELRRVHGDVVVDVGATGGREFVDSFIDSEANRLDDAFREELFALSRGNALFTVELLRTLQDRAAVVRDEQGRWVAKEDLDWNELPARVEGVVAARIDRLADELRDLLAIASIEGEDFTAEAVARVHHADTRDTIRLLSRELEKRHRLVKSRGIRTLASGRFSLFHFSHALFQRFVYNGLNDAERAQLHEDVGSALEALYADDCEEIAVQLAHHYQEAGLTDKAIHYLVLAGRLAVRKAANVEAIGHFRRALELLAASPGGGERDRQELLIQLALYTPLIAMMGWGADEVGRTTTRALELSHRVEDDDLVCTALYLLARHHNFRAEYGEAASFAERMLEIAEDRDDELQIIMAKWALSLPTINQGDFESARKLQEDVLAFYDPEAHSALRFVYSIDPGVSCRGELAIVLMALGYLDAARRLIEEGHALARRLDHPVSESFLAVLAFKFFMDTRDFQGGRCETDRLIDIATQRSLPVELAVGRIYDAILRALEVGVGSDREPEVLALRAALEEFHFLAWGGGSRAVAALELAALGRIPEALGATDLALEFIEAHNEKIFEAQVLTSRGELLMAVNEAEEAEETLTRALEVARNQKARYLELLAATALARLWQGQGKTSEARELLEPLYGWFTEGLDSAPLVEARELLEQLQLASATCAGP
jgi:DNA-binding winged helix-turn-helix (wHTH) protein/tetratricopeptide (TPR) repeat protein